MAGAPAGLWAVHRVDAGDVKDTVSGQLVRSVAFIGHRTRKLIKRAEAQLDVAPS